MKQKDALRIIADIIRHGSEEKADAARQESKEEESKLEEALKAEAHLQDSLNNAYLKGNLSKEEYEEFRTQRLLEEIRAAKKRQSDPERVRRVRRLAKKILDGEWTPEERF